MVQEMNLPTKQKHTHRHGDQTWGCQEGKAVHEGWTRSVGLADADCHIQDG